MSAAARPIPLKREIHFIEPLAIKNPRTPAPSINRGDVEKLVQYV